MGEVALPGPISIAAHCFLASFGLSKGGKWCTPVKNDSKAFYALLYSHFSVSASASCPHVSPLTRLHRSSLTLMLKGNRGARRPPDVASRLVALLRFFPTKQITLGNNVPFTLLNVSASLRDFGLWAVHRSPGSWRRRSSDLSDLSRFDT